MVPDPLNNVVENTLQYFYLTEIAAHINCKLLKKMSRTMGGVLSEGEYYLEGDSQQCVLYCNKFFKFKHSS